MKYNINDLLAGRVRRTILNGNYALADVVRNVSALKAPRFVSFIYENEYEISAVTVLVGLKLENAYRRDLASLYELKNHERNALKMLAIDEIVSSLENSLEKGIGNNDAYTCKGVYSHMEGQNNAVKVHDANGMVYLTGTVVRKKVLAYKKERKAVKSADKTILKNQIKKDYCKLSSFRQYKLDATSLTSISFAHNRIIFNSEKYNAMAKLVHQRKAPLSIAEYQALNMEIAYMEAQKMLDVLNTAPYAVVMPAGREPEVIALVESVGELTGDPENVLLNLTGQTMRVVIKEGAQAPQMDARSFIVQDENGEDIYITPLFYGPTG